MPRPFWKAVAPMLAARSMRPRASRSSPRATAPGRAPRAGRGRDGVDGWQRVLDQAVAPELVVEARQRPLVGGPHGDRLGHVHGAAAAEGDEAGGPGTREHPGALLHVVLHRVGV